MEARQTYDISIICEYNFVQLLQNTEVEVQGGGRSSEEFEATLSVTDSSHTQASKPWCTKLHTFNFLPIDSHLFHRHPQLLGYIQ